MSPEKLTLWKNLSDQRVVDLEKEFRKSEYSLWWTKNSAYFSHNLDVKNHKCVLRILTKPI